MKLDGGRSPGGKGAGGLTAGERQCPRHGIGIEAENTGAESDTWPAVQIDAYQRGCAAILRHIGRGAEFCCGHKEYALPKGRKQDPNFDMNTFRAAVSDLLDVTVTTPYGSSISNAGRPRIGCSFYRMRCSSTCR